LLVEHHCYNPTSNDLISSTLSDNLRLYPFYRAGLIPIGDMQPLAVESWAERNMLLLAGLLLLLIAAIMAGRRFSKQ
jgi:hypothetical protein